MKLFGSNRYGVIAANNVSFGSVLSSELNFLTHLSSKSTMAWHWWAFNVSWNSMTPIIVTIGLMKLFGSIRYGVWLQTM
jgi:hypothetical protein